MRALQAAVIAMGVLIVIATAAMIALVVHRATTRRAPAQPEVARLVLNEPPGTRIARSEAAGERLVLQLTGGGPDRVVVLNLRDGAVLARIGLAQ